MEIDFLDYVKGEVEIKKVVVSDIQSNFKTRTISRSKARSLIHSRHKSYAVKKLHIARGMLNKVRVALHHSVDGKKLQAVVREIHSNWGHVGGMAESYLK